MCGRANIDLVVLAQRLAQSGAFLSTQEMALFQLSKDSKVHSLHKCQLTSTGQLPLPVIKHARHTVKSSAHAASSLQGHLESGKGAAAGPNPAAFCAVRQSCDTYGSSDVDAIVSMYIEAASNVHTLSPALTTALGRQLSLLYTDTSR